MIIFYALSLVISVVLFFIAQKFKKPTSVAIRTVAFLLLLFIVLVFTRVIDLGF